MVGNNPTMVSFAQTSVNQAVIACALERYRLTHGAYPESLDPLVRAYLNKIPRDVSRGRPMSYQRDDKNSYALRGAGPDGNVGGKTVVSRDDWLWSLTATTNEVPPAVMR